MFRGIAIGNSFRKVANKTICKENLIFNPAYLTDTEWVSKTDSVPVLSLNGIDNYLNSDIIPYLSDTRNAWKIKTRFRFTAWKGNDINTIFSNRVSTIDGVWLYYNNSTNIFSFQIRKAAYSDETQIESGQINIELDEWIDLEISYDGSKKGNGIIIKLNNIQLITTVTNNRLQSDLLLCNVFGLFTDFTTYPTVNYYSSVDVEYFTIQDGSDNYIARWVLTDLLDREGDFDLTLGGTLTDCWSKRRVLLNNEDRTYLSNIEKVKAKLVNSTCVQLNKTANNVLNILNTSTYQLSNGDELYYEFITPNDIKTGTYAPIFCKRQADSQPGNFILQKYDNNQLYFRIWDKNNTFIPVLSNILILQPNTHYRFLIKIENNIFKFYNHDILLVTSNGIDLTGFTSSNLISLDGQLNSPSYTLQCKILRFNIKRNDSYLYYSDFTYNTNSTCYDQVAGTPYTVSGDPVSLVNQDVLHSKIRKGYSLIAGEIIPPSLSESEKDVLGNDLSHPAKSNDDNYSGTTIDLSSYVNAGDVTLFNYEDVDYLQLYAKQTSLTSVRYYLFNTVIENKCRFDTLVYCNELNKALSLMTSNVDKQGYFYGIEAVNIEQSLYLTDYDNLMILHTGQSNSLSVILENYEDIPAELQAYTDNVFLKFANKDAYSITEMYSLDPVQYPVYSIPALTYLNLAKLTGKKIYVAVTGRGGSAFYVSPYSEETWMAETGELSTKALQNYLDLRDSLDGQNNLDFWIYFNQSEQSAMDESEANEYNLLQYNLFTWWRNEIGVDMPILTPILNYYSAFINGIYWGEITNAAKLEIAYNKNSDYYMSNVYTTNPSSYSMLEDKTHYPLETNIILCEQYARKMLHLPIESEKVEIFDYPSLKNTSNFIFPSDFYPRGAKTIIIKYNRENTSAVREVFLEHAARTTTGGIRFSIPANQNYSDFTLYEGNTSAVALFSGSTRNGTGVHYIGISWDGTTDENKVRQFQLNNKTSNIFQRYKTATLVESENNATGNLVCSATNDSLLGVYSFNREITDEEIYLIQNDKIEEIQDIRYFLFNQGAGSDIFDNLGNTIELTGFARDNSDIKPYSLIGDNFIIQKNISTNEYRIINSDIPVSLGDWEYVENYNPNYLYYVFGNKIKLPQINNLIEIDTNNVFYDENGASKEILVSDLIEIESPYVITVFDSIKIKKIHLLKLTSLAVIFSMFNFSLNNTLINYFTTL